MNEVRYWIRKFRTAFFYGPEVVTRYVLIAKVVLLLVHGIFLSTLLQSSYVVFSTETSLHFPWTFLTYPIATIDLIELILAGWLFWFVGGSIERSFPRHVYIRLLVVLTALTSASLFVGSMIWELLGISLGSMDVYLAGLWMPASALFVCWIYFNPPRLVIPFLPFRLDSVRLFWIIVGLTLFHFAVLQRAPLIAPFSLAPIYYALRFTQRVKFVPTPGSGPRRGSRPRSLLMSLLRKIFTRN